jgi:hypothetical protein
MKVGHLNAQFLVTVGHLKTFFARVVENLISQILGGAGGHVEVLN